MSQAARVTSIDAIKDFRAALCRFGEEATNALGGIDMEINRALDWLAHGQMIFWQREVRRRQDEVAQARTELYRRRLSSGSDRQADCTEQKEALRRAQRRLGEAEDKVAKVRAWGPQLQRAIDEYQRRARPLGDMLVADLGRALALLEHMTAALDAYLNLAPPSVPNPAAAAMPSMGVPLDRAAPAAPDGTPQPAEPPAAEAPAADPP